jgi:hypothetical protein
LTIFKKNCHCNKSKEKIEFLLGLSSSLFLYFWFSLLFFYKKFNIIMLDKKRAVKGTIEKQRVHIKYTLKAAEIVIDLQEQQQKQNQLIL